MLSSLIGLIGPISLIVALLLLIHLSRRLGKALKRRKWYRLLYISVLLIALGIVFRALILTQTISDDKDNALLYLLPIAGGLIIAVIVVWRYWSWLLNEGTSGGPPI